MGYPSPFGYVEDGSLIFFSTIGCLPEGMVGLPDCIKFIAERF